MLILLPTVYIFIFDHIDPYWKSYLIGYCILETPKCLFFSCRWIVSLRFDKPTIMLINDMTRKAFTSMQQHQPYTNKLFFFPKKKPEHSIYKIRIPLSGTPNTICSRNKPKKLPFVWKSVKSFEFKVVWKKKKNCFFLCSFFLQYYDTLPYQKKKSFICSV